MLGLDFNTQKKWWLLQKCNWSFCSYLSRRLPWHFLYYLCQNEDCAGNFFLPASAPSNCACIVIQACHFVTVTKCDVLKTEGLTALFFSGVLLTWAYTYIPSCQLQSDPNTFWPFTLSLQQEIWSSPSPEAIWSLPFALTAFFFLFFKLNTCKPIQTCQGT